MVRTCKQVLCVTLASFTSVPVNTVKGKPCLGLLARETDLLGTEGCGHGRIVGGLYIMLRARALRAVETLLYHPFSTHSFRFPSYLGRNYLLSHPSKELMDER